MSINYLSNIEFRFSIKRLPNTEFYIQGVTMPGINSGFTTQPSPMRNIFRPGDKLEFEDLVLRCVVDENMASFREVWDWLVGITKPVEFDQYKTIKEGDDGIYSDATLTILNSAKNPHLEINFKDLFPIGVSNIDLDTKQTDMVPPTVEFTFKYGTYDINILS
jgi:hypothetical protein